MNRTPPPDVRRQLRREVGFGCPVRNCRSPYLDYHHFDPPWHEKQHHDPEGMIALCAVHHGKADGRSFTTDQLRKMKQLATGKNVNIRHRFDWIRNNLLAVVGGSFFFECPVVLWYHGENSIFFRRDEMGHFLLNVRLPSPTGEPRLVIEDNDWILRGETEDFECSPSGNRLMVKYPDHDTLKVEFREFTSTASLRKRYPAISRDAPFPLPLATVEITLRVKTATLRFSADGFNMSGRRGLARVFVIRAPVAVAIGDYKGPGGILVPD